MVVVVLVRVCSVQEVHDGDQIHVEKYPANKYQLSKVFVFQDNSSLLSCLKHDEHREPAPEPTGSRNQDMLEVKVPGPAGSHMASRCGNNQEAATPAIAGTSRTENERKMPMHSHDVSNQAELDEVDFQSALP